MPIRFVRSWKRHFTLSHYGAQPDFDHQYRISRNKPRDAFVAISQMWADANPPIPADFHAKQRVFYASNRLTATKPSCVVKQDGIVDDSKHVLGQRPDLLLLNPHLLAFVQKKIPEL